MDMETLWAQARNQLQLELNKAIFDTWVAHVRPVHLDVASGVLTLASPHPYARDWMENRLAAAVKRILAHIAGRPLDVIFVATPADEQPEDWREAHQREVDAAGPRFTREAWIEYGLPPKLADETLETLDWARPALAAPGLQEYARNVLSRLNAGINLFLCGSAGVGKSHLAAGLFKCAVEAEWNAYWTRPASYLERLRAVFDAGRRKDNLAETEAEVLDTLVSADLLVLDDLSLSDVQTDFGRDRLRQVIHLRDDRALPVIVTTNAALDELADAGLDDSTLDRLTSGETYALYGESYRAERQRQRRQARIVMV